MHISDYCKHISDYCNHSHIWHLGNVNTETAASQNMKSTLHVADFCALDPHRDWRHVTFDGSSCAVCVCIASDEAHYFWREQLCLLCLHREWWHVTFDGSSCAVCVCTASDEKYYFWREQSCGFSLHREWRSILLLTGRVKLKLIVRLSGKTHFRSISLCYNLFEFMLLRLYMNLLSVS